MSEVSLTEKSNPETSEIDLMNSFEIAQAINREDKKVALAIEKVLPDIARGIDKIASSFLKGGKLAYFGAGTSGRIGVLDASECWPTFGVEHDMVCAFIAGGDEALRYSAENAEDSSELGKKDLAAFAPHPDDVVVGISAHGSPQYVLSVLEEAKKAGASTIGITSNPQAAMKKYCDIFINPIVGEEVITGSSRMKSGTAQKMILNMLSTGAMIRIGKTYHNYMIDLRILNAKLLQRAKRFVAEIASISEEEAGIFLQKSQNNVKAACVMAVKKCSYEQALKLLADKQGILRKIIG
ncbi:MAG: N-acetylmuramic acid 6-phosphate etherase [Alphaproteobacteria bacterium]|nr:N-acetylmuramic acid 6-phosphate etherase [Alphaproteobacteria bacterium]